MALKTRTPLEREHDLRETGALYLRGLTQAEIAQQLNVSRQQIGYDLKALQRRWQDSSLADFNAKKAAELAKMDELERTYWEAWERSCQAREITTQERTQGGKSPAPDSRLKAGVRKEPRDGNPEFLRGVERCIEMRCKIIGAFAAVKIAPTTPDGQEEWHANDRETNAVLRVAFARASRGLAGCSVLSTCIGSRASSAAPTPVKACSSTPGIETERCMPSDWNWMGFDSTPRNFPRSGARFAIGPPAWPPTMAPRACCWAGLARWSVISPTSQLPSSITPGVRPITAKLSPSSASLPKRPRWI